jgi:opacity protein-like surface antigen
MRKTVLIAAIAVLGTLAIELPAQVAPAARVGGFPISVGIGMSGYYLDYGPGRWMEGPVIRAGVTLYHGIGIDGSARAIFMNTPAELTRMQQNTFLGGVYYEGPHIGRLRPFARAAAGLGTIEFPSRNPKYTRDSYSVFAPSGGVEFQLSRKVALRADYEYQFWKDFHGIHYLNPQGVTLGVNYYLRGRHLRPHPENN